MKKTRFTFLDHWQELVKEYRFQAVVSGEPEKNAGVISSWMNEGQLNISHTNIPKNNFEHTTTHYKKIRSGNGYSLLELHPEGSFRNQIRFHMHELKIPVVGISNTIRI
ncbi:MAG: pseudouridine synthase [Bacteroides sp.]|nr:pseudouridine synthase [Bacteroides sp.]